MKSERITFLATPEFKATLRRTAVQEQVSVGALIRAQFDTAANPDTPDGQTQELRQLTQELRRALQEARQTLRKGLAEAEHALHDLQRANTSGTQQRQVA